VHLSSIAFRSRMSDLRPSNDGIHILQICSHCGPLGSGTHKVPQLLWLDHLQRFVGKMSLGHLMIVAISSNSARRRARRDDPENQSRPNQYFLHSSGQPNGNEGSDERVVTNSGVASVGHLRRRTVRPVKRERLRFPLSAPSLWTRGWTRRLLLLGHRYRPLDGRIASRPAARPRPVGWCRGVL
jgi:hypothetical protein